MTPDDAKNIQLQTQGARVAATVLKTPTPYKPIELATRRRRCAMPVEELLSLAKWNGPASDDDAKMLTAAGVAAYFVAILACRGPYSDLVKLRKMAGSRRVIDWHPTRDAILQHLSKRAGDTPHPPKPTICTQLCVYLETRWPTVFESDATFTAFELATTMLTSGLCSSTTEPHVLAWCRALPTSDMESIVDFDAEVLVDTKCMPDGLPRDDVELCLELISAGRRLLETQPGSSPIRTSIAFEPTRQYAALEPFQRNGLEPRNVTEAYALLRTSAEQCRAVVVVPDAGCGVDLNDPNAFLTPGTGRFWFDSVTSATYAADFRYPSQRVRQYEFVQHYMRLLATSTSAAAAASDAGIGVDDVTVMLNMAAHLDRMWRRDFEAYGIVGNPEKTKLRLEQQNAARGRAGDDTTRAMGDIQAVQKLGRLDASQPEQAIMALQILRTAGASRNANYMTIEYPWPANMTPELVQLRHELGVFRYNRATLPFAMERLVLDIIVVEACCVRVLDTLSKSSLSREDGRQAWVVVCFAMFTIFDLRPIFMSSMPMGSVVSDATPTPTPTVTVTKPPPPQQRMPTRRA